MSSEARATNWPKQPPRRGQPTGALVTPAARSVATVEPDAADPSNSAPSPVRRTDRPLLFRHAHRPGRTPVPMHAGDGRPGELSVSSLARTIAAHHPSIGGSIIHRPIQIKSTRCLRFPVTAACAAAH